MGAELATRHMIQGNMPRACHPNSHTPFPELSLYSEVVLISIPARPSLQVLGRTTPRMDLPGSRHLKDGCHSTLWSIQGSFDILL